MFRIGLLALALTTALCTSSALGGNNYHQSNGHNYRGHSSHSQQQNRHSNHRSNNYRNNHRHQGTYGRTIHWNGGGIYWGNGQNHFYQRPSWNHYPRYRW